jgi:predicted histone-like DNA-binding protein
MDVLLKEIRRYLMPVKFNIVERGNPGNLQAPKKFYPSIQSSGRVTTREVAEMAAQRSTLSTMDMMAAIESFMAIVPEQLAKGNIVELGEFGNFWVRIEAVKPRFNPGKLFKKALDAIDFVKGVRTTETPEEE